MGEFHNLGTVPITDKAFEAVDHTALYWLGAAGFMLNVRGQIVFVDPVLRMHPIHPRTCETGNRMKLSYPIDSRDVPRVDDVLYTHSDEDHMGQLTVHDLASKEAVMWGSPNVFYKLMGLGMRFEKCRVCRAGDKITLKNLTIEVIPADHPWQLMNPQKSGKPFRTGDCLGYIVETPDGRFLFPGDTRLMEHHLDITNIQVLALDVSICRYHLGPDGAVVLANSLPDALIVPMHYGTYDEPTIPGHCDAIEEIIPRILNHERRVRILSPGQPLRVKNGAET
jgi:L-ascorbate metabolism protein UlaG (beta-lactamase superfamily)